MKMFRISYKAEPPPANLVLSENSDGSDPNEEYMEEAKERLGLLRREGWRLSFLLKWFQLQVGQRKKDIDTPEVKKWVLERVKLFHEGNREFRYQSFLKVLCIQQRFPDVSDRELMLATMIVTDAYDYYKENGKI